MDDYEYNHLSGKYSGLVDALVIANEARMALPKGDAARAVLLALQQQLDERATELKAQLDAETARRRAERTAQIAENRHIIAENRALLDRLNQS